MADAEAAAATAENAARADPPGDADWNNWDTPPRAPKIPVLHLEGFDGPMDLLLDLAERQRIDFGRMSVQALAEQFVAALERLAGQVTLEQRADWLVIAARLVQLRARLLFPQNPQAAEQAERDAALALQRIDTLSLLRTAVAWLERRPQLGVDVFARPHPAPPREGGYVALMQACLVVLRGREGLPAEAPVTISILPDLWRMPDALARIRALLAAHPDGGALVAFLPAIAADDPQRPVKARAAVASTLAAGLELARSGVASLVQATDFEPIFVRASDRDGTA